MIVNIDTIKYHINIKGKGFPVVCLHGFSEDETTWDDLEMPNYCLIKIDIIGHGKTDKPKKVEYYYTDCVLEHLNKIVKKLGVNKFILLGYSMGGRIALAYTLRYPIKVSALILESTSYGEEGQKRLIRRKSDEELAEMILTKGISWFQKYWSSLDIFDSQKNLSDGVKNKIKIRRLQNDETALSNTLLGSGQGVFPYLKKEIINLSIPILYICGELDKKYTFIGKEFKMLNSNVQYYKAMNTGHNVHLEKPREFQNILKKFLEEIKYE